MAGRVMILPRVRCLDILELQQKSSKLSTRLGLCKWLSSSFNVYGNVCNGDVVRPDDLLDDRLRRRQIVSGEGVSGRSSQAKPATAGSRPKGSRRAHALQLINVYYLLVK